MIAFPLGITVGVSLLAEPARRVAVRSSVIASIGYDPVTRTLEVEFCSGEIYRYSDVPASVHRAFLASPSKGRFFSHSIRERYRAERIEPPQP